MDGSPAGNVSLIGTPLVSCSLEAQSWSVGGPRSVGRSALDLTPRLGGAFLVLPSHASVGCIAVLPPTVVLVMCVCGFCVPW